MTIELIYELSVIVPVLNEAGEIAELFATLEAQRGISFEVILCDGGSADSTQQHAGELAGSCPHPVHFIRTPRGRGCQMNAGARCARTDVLLFLHADSRFSEPDALSSAVRAFREQTQTSTAPVAARFALNFRRQHATPSLAYSFYESKARLNRADCIRGDQGFILTRSFFQQLGGFDESLPFLEDVRAAFAIEKQVAWTLLPATISTSARRFETEGFYERQVINAIIANAVHLRWDELFPALPELYRCRTESGRLLLFPLLTGIRALIAGHNAVWRRRFWLATGRYVSGNIWQLFFWLDVRRAFREGHQQTAAPGCWSRRYVRFLEPITRTFPAALVTAWAVRIWFRWILATSRREMKTATGTNRTG